MKTKIICHLESHIQVIWQERIYKLNPIEREMALLNSSVVDNRIEEKNFENSKTKTESENNKATSDNNNTEIKNNQNVTGVYTSEMKINNEKNIDAGKS